MFGKSLKLFKLFGFEVKMDWSWIIIAVLIAWSLSTGVFPFQYKNLSIQTYWLMGIVGVLGLFFSIVIHELCHSIVARKYGMAMHGITLFIFGGVAEMREEPPSPKAEFMMAVVGPLSSAALALIFYGVFFMGKGGTLSGPLNGVVGYLAMINGILAGFNLVPAFPLDGGRILRSILWSVKGELRWATRVSSTIGKIFGVLLIVNGVVTLFGGNFIGGMWWALIGMFVYSAAKMSYQQLRTRKALEGESLRRFMNTEPVTVSPATSLDRYVDDYIYKYHYKMFPVVENNGKLLGCITLKQVKEIPREKWKETTVGQMAAACSEKNTIDPEKDAVEALAIMTRTGNSRLMVVDRGRLLGIVSLKDMLKFLSLKLELDKP